MAMSHAEVELFARFQYSTDSTQVNDPFNFAWSSTVFVKKQIHVESILYT